MDDFSNICLSCGLCCDGTLIGFVELGKKEVPALREIMDIEEGNNINIFLQPCDKYCNGCTIYADRPGNCIKFKCGLLNRVEQKDVTFESAVNTIELVKEKKAAIEKQMASLNIDLKSASFYLRMAELNKILHTPKFEENLTAEHLNTITNIRQLKELITKKFNLPFS